MELKEAQGKGRGLFATQDYQPGDLIFQERPALYCGGHGNSPLFVEEMVRQALTLEKAKTMHNLAPTVFLGTL